jgi:hypothetical protein
MTFSGSVETLPRWEAGISRNIANWIPLYVSFGQIGVSKPTACILWSMGKRSFPE